MRFVSTSYSLNTPQTTKSNIFHLLLLLVLLLLSITFYEILASVAKVPNSSPLFPFFALWMSCFLPYFGACIFVLRTKPLDGIWFWVEMGMLLVGGFIFRMLLLPSHVQLSRDVWR